MGEIEWSVFVFAYTKIESSLAVLLLAVPLVAVPFLTVLATLPFVLLAAQLVAPQLIYAQLQEAPPPPANLPAMQPAPASPSTPAAIPVARAPRFIIVLDPAHGGADTGARISDHLLEKDLTLSLAFRLRSLLNARGFTVVTTREADSGVALTSDRRAELSNHSRALACIVLHATATGNGVHIFNSSLAPATVRRNAFVPWDAAQAPFIDSSVRLASELRSAFDRSDIPITLGRTYLRPLDNLACPAVAVELAPLAATSGTIGGKDAQDISNPAYQQRVAEAISWALLEWRMHAADASPATASEPPASASTSSPKETRPVASPIKPVVQGHADSQTKPVGQKQAANQKQAGSQP